MFYCDLCARTRGLPIRAKQSEQRCSICGNECRCSEDGLDYRVRDRSMLQLAVGEWCERAFGAEQANSLPQCGLRFAEEAIELAQACEVDREQLHRLVDFVYGRPVGRIQQEMGGVGVTLLALGAAAGYSAEYAERVEVERVFSKPIEHFTARNEAKNAAGFQALVASSPVNFSTDQSINPAFILGALADAKKYAVKASTRINGHHLRNMIVIVEDLLKRLAPDRC